MSLLGNIIGAAVGGNQGGLASLLPLFIKSDSPVGGLTGLISKLQSGGLGDALSSWLGQGENQSVSAEQIKGALGPDVMQAVMEKLGVDEDSAAHTLKDVMPQIIDKLSPDGNLPSTDGLGAADLMALAGKLFK